MRRSHRRSILSSIALLVWIVVHLTHLRVIHLGVAHLRVVHLRIKVLRVVGPRIVIRLEEVRRTHHAWHRAVFWQVLCSSLLNILLLVEGFLSASLCRPKL